VESEEIIEEDDVGTEEGIEETDEREDGSLQEVRPIRHRLKRNNAFFITDLSYLF